MFFYIYTLWWDAYTLFRKLHVGKCSLQFAVIFMCEILLMKSCNFKFSNGSGTVWKGKRETQALWILFIVYSPIIPAVQLVYNSNFAVINFFYQLSFLYSSCHYHIWAPPIWILLLLAGCKCFSVAFSEFASYNAYSFYSVY